MSYLLVEHADVLVTMNQGRSEITDGALLVENNIIVNIDTSDEMQKYLHQHNINPDEIINSKGTVVLPGLI
ncbi:MAG: 8-oxoguanine deaminase, partial [Gammaproteobacteria bacterium]|nr:8-oxoguanine deaminase [Gammaproteobacteria bacterium]